MKKILIIHGWMHSAERYAKLADDIQKKLHCKVVLYEIPGFGETKPIRYTNLLIPMVAMVVNLIVMINSDLNTKYGYLLVFPWYSYFILFGGVLAIVWSCRINRRYHSKVSYESKMSDKIALRGYINDNRADFMRKTKAVFLDRDGTIIIDKVETRKIEDLEFVNDIDCLKKLKDAGYLLVIITNQSGIGKGHYDVKEMHSFNNHMIGELKKRGILIDALYYCPHTTADNCQCKKPKDGMIRRAELDLNIDLCESVLIGDQNSDIKAGIVAGLKECYAVPTGLYPKNESGKYEVDDSIADKTIVCDNLGDAIDKILRNEFSVNDERGGCLAAFSDI